MLHFYTFEEFWPYYILQHSKPATRAFHFVGTTGALVCVALAVWWSPWWLGAGLVAGYGPAWFSHYFIQRNKPATFQYPLWSLRGDLRMYRLMWLGEMRPEIRRLKADLERLHSWEQIFRD